MMNKINLLFICSRNQWRSPTAEVLWRKEPRYSSRSAGSSPKAKKTVSSMDIRWADLIVVMEPKHKNRLKAQFTRMLDHKTIHVLNITDEYGYPDPGLIDELRMSVNAILDAQA